MAEVFHATVESNVAEVLAADREGLLKAARKIVGGRTKYLKNAIRRAVRAAGLGERLANAVRGETHDLPDGAEGTVWSNAKVKRRGGLVDLIAVFQADQEIEASGGRFLAIPLPAAGRGARGRAARPTDFPSGSLIARVHGDRGVLVAKDHPDEPLFVLVKRVRLKRRLDLERIKRTGTQDLGGRIVREWMSHRARLALRLVA